MLKSARRAAVLVPISLFAISFFLTPFTLLDHLTLMPGDPGDARLNNLFLENIYEFIVRRSDSLWNLGFFYPFPFSGGFSDNLFGSSIAYLVPRFVNVEPFTAFQLWFLFGYVANFASAYYALRRLELGVVAASVGALVFAFALPTTGHMVHAQLQYRFGIPLAAFFYFQFLERKEWRLLAIAGAWLVWQFYCGIYMGFFTLLLLAAMTALFLIGRLSPKRFAPGALIREFGRDWAAIGAGRKIILLIAFAALAALLALLFYPYLRVSRLYTGTRSWEEIATMLPRPRSYLLSDASKLWAPHGSAVFASLPMRAEQQMFFGAVPLVLALIGAVVGYKTRRPTLYLLAGSMILVVLMTISVGHFSLWRFFYWLPLASAIRAMCRLDQALLFPLAYLCGVGVDELRTRRRWAPQLILMAALPALIFEFSDVSMSFSSKQEWVDRLALEDHAVPAGLPRTAILLFAQKGPYPYSDIDAMWVAMDRGLKTMNGYSGLLPPGESLEFGDDCAEAPRRVDAYLAFNRQPNDAEQYRRLINRVVPVGLKFCDPAWLASQPQFTVTDRAYTEQEIRNIAYTFVRTEKADGRTKVFFTIKNAGKTAIAASSSVGYPIRVSWRYLDPTGKPVSGWDTRRDIPFDIPAHGALPMWIAIDPAMEVAGGTLEISLVQDGRFWAHDIGVKPLSIPWS